MHAVYIGAGTNLGDRRANLAAALRALAGLGAVDAISSVFESDPVGFVEQPSFWNLVVRLRTGLEPIPLLHALKRVEHRMGRRPAVRHGPRVIDLDLLLYADRRLSTPELEVPHPRIMERAFVLRPLVELEPDLREPVQGARIADRLAHGDFERAVPLFPGSDLLSHRGDADASSS